MKVNNSSAKPTVSSTVTVREADKNLKTKDKGATQVSAEALAQSSKVNVSQQAQAFQKAKAIASDKSIDEAKVARLQKLIDDGKYKVDSKAVADRLVDEHLLMED